MRNFKESPVEKYRHQADGMESPPGAQFGTFVIPLMAKPGAKPVAVAIVMVDDGGETGWERMTVEMQEKRRAHVSTRAPKLDELTTLKDLFWLGHETVCWFLLAEQDREHVKFPYRVTLWKPRGEKLNTPPLDILG